MLEQRPKPKLKLKKKWTEKMVAKRVGSMNDHEWQKETSQVVKLASKKFGRYFGRYEDW